MTTTTAIKSIIETVTCRRNLPTNARLADLNFSESDLHPINTKLTELYHHHMQVYLVDTIEDIARIINGKF